jgi:hypothetical protein
MNKKPQQNQAKKRGPGRPATGTDPILTVRVPVDLLRDLDKSRGEGETRTDLVRAAIEREIARRR